METPVNQEELRQLLDGEPPARVPGTPGGALQIILGRAPLPRAAERPSIVPQVFAALELMEVGDSLDLDRPEASLETWIYQYRRGNDRRDRRFIVRYLKPGWCRVWRKA